MNERKIPQLSLAVLLAWLTILALGFGYLATSIRLRASQAEADQLRSEVDRLRSEIGYLPSAQPDQVAAVRLISDEPLTYRFRVRVPSTAPSRPYRVSYSALWPDSAAHPDWFAAVSVPTGESMVIVRVAVDPRDDRWKITTLVRSSAGVRRFATALPEKLALVFQGSHDTIRAGIDHQPVFVDSGQSIRILDERWLVGEGGMLLYGSRPPEEDQVGVFAELQVADEPLHSLTTNRVD